jgi:hypothetical protein
MKPPKSSETVLRRVGWGFGTIVALIWLVEAIKLPHLLFGEPAIFYWPRVLFRTVVVGGIWLWMHLTIERLLFRMRELEELLRICSWCRKIGYQGRWLTLEEFFGSAFATPTSHGICPDCAEKARAKIPTVPPA